jgi:hypothetical protein
MHSLSKGKRRLWILFRLILILPIPFLFAEVGLRGWSKWRVSSNPVFQERVEYYTKIVAAELDESGGIWKERWWSYKPNATLIFGGRTFATNSRGYRTPEFEPMPPQDTMRIITLGGSTTVAGKISWPNRLQEKLDGLGRFEVVNLAVSGADLGVSLKRLVSEVEEYHPDAVFIYHGVNCVKGKPQLIWPWLGRVGLVLQMSELFEWLTLPWRDEHLLQEHFHPQLEDLNKIAQWCQARGIKLFVSTFAIPRSEDFSAIEWEYLSMHSKVYWVKRDIDVYTWTLEVWNDSLRRLSQAGDFTLIDIEPDLKGSFFMDPCHLYDAGLELQSQLIFDQLKPHLVDQI